MKNKQTGLHTILQTLNVYRELRRRRVARQLLLHLHKSASQQYVQQRVYVAVKQPCDDPNP
jgi:hypothetical protein